MIARAPGKVVLSGAYSVLEGAPALVAAVDRYVRADTSRPAELVTEEVRRALEAGVLQVAPWFDASALRRATPDGASRKLGLGSSAAILVASLGASLGTSSLDDDAFRAAVLEHALAAHRSAQGGGSGVDVAASVYGGVLECRRRERELECRPHALPSGVVIEVFASRVAASTRDLLEVVRAAAARDTGAYSRAIARAGAGAEAASAALTVGELASAIDAQTDALAELGRVSGAPIVTGDVAELAGVARREGGVFAPSGAGGGDVAVFVGRARSSPELRLRAAALGLERLELELGAPGLMLEPP